MIHETPLVLVSIVCLLIARPSVASDPPGHTRCFDQQYSTLEVDLKAVVSLQKLAILAPIGIYHVHTETSDGVFSQLLQKNGRPMLLYSSLTAGNAEWLTCSVLAKRLRLVPVFSKQENAPVSVFVSACRHETDIITMDDRSFYVDTRSAGLVSMYENVLSVVFRTYYDGIFLFSGAEQGDLLVAQITAGRVYVIFDFGSLSYMEISGGTALNDGAWHELRWVHEFDSVELLVDGVLENSTSPTGLYRKLDFHTEIEIGGRPFDAQSNTIQSSYRGCLASVRLNNVELLSFAPKGVYAPCSLPHNQMITIAEGGSVSIPYSFLPFAFEFRVLPMPGEFLKVLEPKNESLFTLFFNKNMSLEMNANSTFTNHISQPDIRFDDGSWHSMIFNIRNGRLEVEVDGVTIIWLEGSIVRTIALRMSIFRLSAIGCYRSHTVSLRSAHVTGLVQLDKCVYENKCRTGTCENEGTCVQTSLTNFRCECRDKHSGTFCHTSVLPRSCEEFFRSVLSLYSVKGTPRRQTRPVFAR
uniref:Neurexin-4 n=1 Tax=Steinernema glaseri TaxID=37863 RepID=A0A1I7YX68_9BILA